MKDWSMRRAFTLLLTIATSVSVWGCSSGSGSSAPGTDSTMTLNSVFYGRLVKVNGVDQLMPPDSEVSLDPATGELIEVIDPGTEIRSLDSNVISNLFVPRNAALLLRFSDQVNPATADTNTIQVRDGDAPSRLVRGRYIVNGRDVIFDPAIESFDQLTNPELPLNPQGLPKSFISDASNLQILIPTQANSVVRNTKGRSVTARTVDVESGQVDIWIRFRSGGDFDKSRGYLPDSTDPFILTRLGEEYVGNLFPNPFDIADVVFFDFPPNDDEAQAPVENFNIFGNDSRVVNFGNDTNFLVRTPVVPGSVQITEKGNLPNRLVDQPIDANNDDIPDYGLINAPVSIEGEDTGQATADGNNQDFGAGVSLSIAPIAAGSLTLRDPDDPTNTVTDNGAGSIGGTGVVDYATATISGVVTFPFGMVQGGTILASYGTTLGGRIYYDTGEIEGVLNFPSAVSSLSLIEFKYRNRVSTNDIVEQVPNFSAIHLRFSEPMNPESIGPFSTMFCVKNGGDPKFPADAYFGRVESNASLTEFIFRPPLQPQGWGSEGSEYILVVRTDNPNTSPVEGITDLAGRGIRTGLPDTIFSADEVGFEGLRFRFVVKEDIEAIEGGLFLETFDDLTTYNNIVGNNHNQSSPPSVIEGGPVFSWSHDLENFTPTDGAPAITPNFPPGVQTPFNPNGARIQHCVPRTILSSGGASGSVWTMTGLAWAPIGDVVFADTWNEFSIDVSHTHVVPNTKTNSGGFLTDPRSGLKQFFAQNIKKDDPPSPTTVIDRGRTYSVRPPTNLPNPFRVDFPKFDRSFPYNTVSSILLDMGVAASPAGGYNGYKIFISVQGWADPAFRIFTAGMAGFVVSDPWSLDRAGGTGGNTNQWGDNSIYIHRFDFKIVETKAESTWFEIFEGAPAGFELDWNAPVFEPDLALLPTGTQIDVEYRGADDGSGTNPTEWSTSHNILDGRVSLMFRLTFKANPETEQVPGIDSLAVPYSLIPLN